VDLALARAQRLLRLGEAAGLLVLEPLTGGQLLRAAAQLLLQRRGRLLRLGQARLALAKRLPLRRQPPLQLAQLVRPPRPRPLPLRVVAGRRPQRPRQLAALFALCGQRLRGLPQLRHRLVEGALALLEALLLLPVQGLFLFRLALTSLHLLEPLLKVNL